MNQETTTPRVLFVDDEPNVLKALRRIFLDEEIEIITAESGDKGLEYLQNNPVDLILSDHNMPGLTGVEFLRRSQEICPDAIRMLITGKGDMDLALQAINRGQIYKFFNKPWEDEALLISIKRALEFKRTREKMRQQQEELARLEAYRQTMVTVSHYINNFNCALIMSLESLKRSSGLSDDQKDLAASALKAAEKVSEVLRILNRMEELRVVDYDPTLKMIDIDGEVQAAVKKIEEG